MALALRTILGTGYSATAPTEMHYLAATIRGQRGEKRGLIYCHGSGDTAESITAKTGQRPLLDALAQEYAVIGADLGLQAWGNDTHVARIIEARDYLSSQFGTSGKVLLVGVSMGMLGALGYARLYPGNVQAVVGIIGAMDLADLLLRGAATSINAAYPPAYDDATDGPTHSPVKYAASLDASLPIRLYTASNDPTVVPTTADAFVAARPQTTRVDVGALGHSEASITAATAPAIAWLKTVA